jgi:hypothetical protein
MERVDLKFTCRSIKTVRPRLIGGAPAVGIEIEITQADPDQILEDLFKHFGKDKLIRFLED